MVTWLILWWCQYKNRTLPHFLEDKLKESRTSLRRNWTNLPRNPFQHRWPRLDAGRERSLRLPGLSWLHVSGRCRDPQTAKKHQCIYGCCKSAAATESKFHPLPANNTWAKPWLEKAGCYRIKMLHLAKARTCFAKVTRFVNRSHLGGSLKMSAGCQFTSTAWLG